MKRIILCLIVFGFYAAAQIPNVRINKLESWDPEEVTIAINPIDPNVLAGGANISYFYHSSDAGQTWSESRLMSSLGVWGDPCVVFDGLGNLFFAHLSNPINGYWIDRIVVQRSTDNGQTWNDGAGVGLTYPKNQDKEWLAVDLTNSRFRNNVYMSWTEFDSYGSNSSNDSSRILFSRSTDNGLNWSDPVRLSDNGGNCIDDDETVEGAVPAVGPNGEVFVAWSGPLGIMFDKSTDGGQTFGEDIFITDHPGGWAFDIPGIYRCNGMPITACDVSNSEYRGNVYVGFGGLRNGNGDGEIYFVKSTDKGETWGNVIRVNDDNTERHQFFPWMTVDSTTGFIYFVFYDRRNTSGLATDVWAARSTDGGDTFENFKLSESSFTPNSSVFFGDYTNIAAYKGKVYPIWMRLDNYTLSVWTAPFTDTLAITGINEKENLPHGYTLNQNYPNPFNPSCTIGFEIPHQSNVMLKVFDALGREVALLLDKQMSAGMHETQFDAEELNSGVYFYQLSADNFLSTKKMILLK